MAESRAFSTQVVDAGSLGLDPDRLGNLKSVIEEDTAKGVYDGAVFIVARHGSIAMHEAVGQTDREKGRFAKLADIFFIMSISKQITAVRVLMDVEKGKYTLSTPVCEIIPEFGVKGKQGVTIGHILTHTSGLNTEIPYGLPVEQLANIEGVTAAIANERVLVKPGEMLAYNCIAAFSVLGVVVQRMDEKKRPYRQILREDIFEPLGMAETFLQLPDASRERLVPIVVRDRTPGLFEPLLLEAMNFLANEESELPAGSVISTADDVLRFMEMMRRGGELDGARLLSPGMVKFATTPRTSGMRNHLLDYMCEMYGWTDSEMTLGITFFVKESDMAVSPFGKTVSPGTFAAFGAGSTMAWVDPVRDLSFVFLSAGLMEEGASIMRHQRLADLVVACVTD